MAKDEGDDDTLEAVAADLEGVESTVAGLEFRRMFNQPADPNNWTTPWDPDGKDGHAWGKNIFHGSDKVDWEVKRIINCRKKTTTGGPCASTSVYSRPRWTTSGFRRPT